MSSAQATTAPSSPLPGSQAPSQRDAQPTPATIITYGDKFVKARIDSNVPLEEILRQLCTSSQLDIKDARSDNFALRDTVDDALLTVENFASRLEGGGARLKLVPSPVVEAGIMIQRLQSHDLGVLKLATFSLKALIADSAFTLEFVRTGGIHELAAVINRVSGNALAYALSSLQSLMELDLGWEAFDDILVTRLVQIIAQQTLTNVVRPATAILRNFVVSESAALEEPSTSTRSATQSRFLRIWSAIQHQPAFLSAVSGRLSAGDKLLVQASLALLNALSRPAIELNVEDFLQAVAKLDIQSLVLRLAESTPSADLLPFILEYQAILVSLHRTDHRPVTSASASELALLDELAAAAQTDLLTLGVDPHDLDGSFGEPGVLGLKALCCFTQRKGDLAKALSEQSDRDASRRFSIARAASEVMAQLAERLHFFPEEAIDMVDLDLALLAWPQLFALSLKMFFKFWADSGSTVEDFARMANLVRTQIRVIIGGQADTVAALQEMERALLTAEYRAARERLSKEMEIEDDLLTKAPIRSLRARLYKESFDFVRAQRLRCLSDGAWFKHSVGRKSGSSRSWRFYRLASNQRYLHYVERDTRMVIRGGLEELPDRIDLENITDIVPATAAAGRQHTRTPSIPRTAGPSLDPDSALRFSLISGDQLVAEMQAPDRHVYAEWLDGLSLLKPNGHIRTQETADLVQTLTDISVKVKLLQISGERIEIPTHCPVVGVPLSEDFHYATV